MATRTLSSTDVAEAIPSGLHHRFTVDEYHRMIEAGIVKEDDRVQLIGGVVVEMSPQNERHARVIQRLNRSLVRTLSDEYVVRPQLPLTLEPDGEPEPDLAVVRSADADSPTEHPRSAVLVVEVSGDSLKLDRGVRASLYAAAGIPEYWIVDLESRRVEVRSDPDPASSRYRSSATFDTDALLASTSIPDLTLSVSALFG